LGFPDFVAPILTAICAKPEFGVDDLPSITDSASTEILLRRLLEEGFVGFAEHRQNRASSEPVASPSRV